MRWLRIHAVPMSSPYLWGGQSCPQPPFRRLLGHQRAFVLGRRPAESRLQPGLAAPQSCPFVLMPPGPRYLALFFISDSTFLNPAGTSKSEGSTAFEENVLISVVISSSEPGAPDPGDACPPEAC